MSREQIYDEKFSPLVQQLIDLAKEHDIPLLFQCQINDNRDTAEDGENFFCTTVVLPANAAPSMKKAAAIMKPPPPQWAAFVTTPEGTTQVAGSNMPDKKS